MASKRGGRIGKKIEHWVIAYLGIILNYKSSLQFLPTFFLGKKFRMY
jgi:hypothetical protein